MLRKLAFTPLALLVTLALFLIMAQLAGINQPVEKVIEKTISLQLQRLHFDDDVQVRQREALTLPEYTPAQSQPDTPEVEVTLETAVQPVAVQLDLPDIQLDMQVKIAPQTEQLVMEQPEVKPAPEPAPKPVLKEVAEPPRAAETAPAETVPTEAPPVNQPSTSLATAPVALPAELRLDTAAVPRVRINPKYPRRALRRGIQGYVVAEYQVDAAGNVIAETLQIVDAKPKGTFDKAVRKAVLGWRYAATGQPYRTRQRLEFQIK